MALRKSGLSLGKVGVVLVLVEELFDPFIFGGYRVDLLFKVAEVVEVGV